MTACAKRANSVSISFEKIQIKFKKIQIKFLLIETTVLYKNMLIGY
jgi:hypothetical protein